MTSTKSLTAVRAVVAIYREFEQAARRSDISMAQYRLMLYLRNGPKRAGEIAAAAEIAKPTVSLGLNALREKGWVEGLASSDGRVSRVLITPAGKARMDAFEQEMSSILDGMLGGDDLVTLRAALEAAYVAMEVSKDERMKTAPN